MKPMTYEEIKEWSPYHPQYESNLYAAFMAGVKAAEKYHSTPKPGEPHYTISLDGVVKTTPAKVMALPKFKQQLAAVRRLRARTNKDKS